MSPSFVRIISKDWFEEPIFPPFHSNFQRVGENFLFTASRAAKAQPHPPSVEGAFQPELWKYDVAEIFLLEPCSGRYLEINLAPNGGWWACWFDDVRVPSPQQPDFSGITAEGKISDSYWEASIRLPLSLFESPATLQYNVTAIMNSPEQLFLTAFPLGPAEPDFHQPSGFQALIEPNRS